MRLRARLWSLVVAGWAAVTGVAPHVLHHVGPIAGTALVAGAGGRLLFGVIGLAATIPMLLKLYRRFHSWLAPAIALTVFAGVFSLSTFVIGPRLSGGPRQAPQVGETEPHGHGHDPASEPPAQSRSRAEP